MPGRFFNVECFAGRSEIAKAFKRGGYPAAALDLKLNPDDAPCSHLKIHCGSAFTVREFFAMLYRISIAPWALFVISGQRPT